MWARAEKFLGRVQGQPFFVLCAFCFTAGWAVMPFFDLKPEWRAPCASALYIVSGLFLILGGISTFYNRVEKTKWFYFREYVEKQIRIADKLAAKGVSAQEGLSWHDRVAKNLEASLEPRVLKKDEIPGGKLRIPKDFSLARQDFDSHFRDHASREALMASSGHLSLILEYASPSQLRKNFDPINLEYQ